jgi:hypothetical protein
MEERYLTIDGHEYRIILYDDKEFVFSRLDPNNSSFDFEDAELTNLTKDTNNPLKVLRIIINEVISMVYENNLTFFRVRSFDDKRTRVYEKLFRKILRDRKLKFDFILYDGYFVFYSSREET